MNIEEKARSDLIDRYRRVVKKENKHKTDSFTQLIALLPA